MLDDFFVGMFTPKLDDKFRLILPAKFRELLSEDVVIAPSQEHCLAVRSKSGFRDFATELLQESKNDRDVRDYMRFLSSNAFEESVDKQGRVAIKPNLREWARLDREVLVIGNLDHAEIWDPATWAASQEGVAERFAAHDGPIGRKD
ncbi:division/cell wall cluster transcriptional repressor MraZ [Alteromonas gracilis]